MVKIKRMEPVMIAVNNLNEVMPFYEKLFGVKFNPAIVEGGSRIATFMIGETYMEIHEPVDPNGGVARFLKSKGPGVWGLVLQVDDIDEAVAELKKEGIRIAYEEILPEPMKTIKGFTIRKKEVFLSPKDTHGMLLMLVETVDPGKE